MIQRYSNIEIESIEDLYALDDRYKDAWMGVDFKGKDLFNPLINIPANMQSPEKFAQYLTWMMTRVEYIHLICKEIFKVELFPYQAVIIKEFWDRKFPMLIGSRGLGKSFLLALYAMLRALLLPGRKIAICGAAYRQSKVLFGYMNSFYEKSPILRNIIKSFPGNDNGPFRGTDICGFRIGESVINCFPLGDGEKIRGQRANDVIADEFGAINQDIFERVIAGFAIVSSNPLEDAKKHAAIKMAEADGLIIPASVLKNDEFKLSNQIIISGTAYYATSHFADYWKMWRARILSRGDMVKYYSLIGKDAASIDEEEMQKDKDTHWKDYCIIRMPFEKVPTGYMDEGQRNRAKASVSRGAYETEYGAVFSKDSDGFFKYSAIEAATTSPRKRFFSHREDGGFTHFIAKKYGEYPYKYVMGVDPAAQDDNFSIIILEIHPDHKRVVYGWTTNKKEQRKRIDAGLITEYNYYAYCAQKIRELKRQFNVERIAIDAGSGGCGRAVQDALCDTDKLDETKNEVPFWEVVDDDKPKETDYLQGEHILEMVNFTSAWISEANHALKRDITDQRLLFPYNDTTELINSGEMSMDPATDKLTFDTLEDVFDEIEELKEELMTIVVTMTAATNKERFDTPEKKLANGKKGRQRKDRYSSLLLANMAARAIVPSEFDKLDRTASGGFAHYTKGKEDEQLGYKVAPKILKDMDSKVLDLYGPV